MCKKMLVLPAVVLMATLLGTPALAAGPATYTVQSGDTLWEIAQRFNTTVGELKAWNDLQGNLIFPGQRLMLHTDQTVTKNPNTYVVKTGDTLWEIARHTGMTVEAIKKANNLNGNLIYPGQLLKLSSAPDSGKTSSDLEWLARVISAEARGENLTGQVAVGAVVLNRVEDPRFPNSIYEVIFQPGQFSCVPNGAIYRQPTATAYRAARLALSGFDPTNGSLYFYNPRLVSRGNWIRSRPVIKSIGNHDFAA